MIYLLNSAVMPCGCYGCYDYHPATVADLSALIRGEMGHWESRIGYYDTARMIEGWTRCGIGTLRVDRREVTLMPGDSAFVARLRYRVADPKTKGAPVSTDPADWEIARFDFTGEV